MKKKVNQLSIHDLMMTNTVLPGTSSVLDKIKQEKMNVKTESAPEKTEAKPEKKPYPVTKLVLYRHYTTYQGIFSIWPKEGTTLEDCYSKTILYVMKWFRSRLGDG